MALTIAAASNGLGPTARNRGASKEVAVTITFDDSYPTGGEAITAADVGLSRIDYVVVPAVNTAASRLFAWDATNGKMLVFTALSTQAANASDQSTISGIFVFVGV